MSTSDNTGTKEHWWKKKEIIAALIAAITAIIVTVINLVFTSPTSAPAIKNPPTVTVDQSCKGSDCVLVGTINGTVNLGNQKSSDSGDKE